MDIFRIFHRLLLQYQLTMPWCCRICKRSYRPIQVLIHLMRYFSFSTSYLLEWNFLCSLFSGLLPPSLLFYLKIDTLLQHWKSSVSWTAADNLFPRGLFLMSLCCQSNLLDTNEAIPIITNWSSHLCQVLALSDYPALLDKSETQGLFRYWDKIKLSGHI